MILGCQRGWRPLAQNTLWSRNSLDVENMAKKKNASSSKKGSADDGAPTGDRADDGASMSALMSGASITDKRAAAASALNLGADSA